MTGIDSAWLAAIIESSDDAIVSKTLEGVVMSWNPGAERLFGYTAAEMVGRPITVLFPPERLAEETDFLTRLARGERIEHYETVRIRKDGTPLDLSVTLSPITDAAGRIVGVSKIARDISERKRVERERADVLRREREALEESVRANRLKDEFLATLSHELRTPVNAILGWAHLLGAGRLDDDERARALDVVVRNAKLQGDLIEQLLDVSGIVAGKVNLDAHPVDFGAVVRSAIDSIRPSLAMKALRLEARIDDEQLQVMGDASRLQQVVWNLLTNALKFTPNEGRIEVTLERHAHMARLTVADSGVGIAPDDLPVIFERFRQADASITRRYGGLGLGLAIVRHLVELHGGSVWAESKGVGTGARFIVELTLLRGYRHGVPASATGVKASDDDGGALRGARILVVEDDDDARRLVGRMLTLAGGAVGEADSAATALAAARRESFDVVVADIGMPEMDGYDMMRALRAQGTSIPGVALTAFATPRDRERSSRAGFLAHIAKPVLPDELVRAVARVLGGSGAHAPTEESRS